MQKITQLFLFILLPLALLACKSKDPNPELRDPIYLDLLKEAKRHEDELKNLEKSLETIEKELAEQKPRSMDLKVKEKELLKTQNRIIHVKQGLKYFEIRAELRRVYARKEYTIAFQKDETWPKPEEFEDYKKNKAMRNISLNWNERVPKLRHLQKKPQNEGGESKEE